MAAEQRDLSYLSRTMRSGPVNWLLRHLRGPGPVTWNRSAGWYLRGLGVIYLIAFISLWTQISGLIGSDGLEPVERYLSGIEAYLGATPWWRVPTLCWLNASDWFLQVQCGAGAILSLLAIAGIAQAPVFACLWVLYLSLAVACQQFLGYQWDALLLEAGLLAIFLAPVRSLAWRTEPQAPPVVMMWMQRWLLFRLIFLSGVVKLTSGDPNWRNLTAMTFHYWSQPLPTWTSWYAAHWPLWFQKFSCVSIFVMELGIPIFVFGPRRVRLVAVVGIVSLQLLILSTGNYGFFNLLAIVLCIPLLDDAMLPRLWPERWTRTAHPKLPTSSDADLKLARLYATVVFSAIVGCVTLNAAVQRAGLRVPLPAGIASALDAFAPLRSMNSYGLFAVMTTDRQEIIFEGSNDKVHWKEYQFKWKPGDLGRRPAFCTPHMPRVDWQLWFASLDPRGNSEFLLHIVQGILRGSEPVMGLMGDDPFNGHPPKFVRLKVYQYRFTTPAQGTATGDWWTRTDTGAGSSEFSLGVGGRSTSSR
jgi:hypothetical protein